MNYYRFVWIIVVFFLVSFSLLAQEKVGEAASQERPAVFDVDAEKALRTNEQIIPQQQFLEQTFEKEVDSTQYILGPGDQLLIKLWGALDEQFPTVVTPEGYVMIPSVAEVFVSGISLAEASERIRARLDKVFKNSHYSIRLVKLRKFRVYVVGEVKTPGTYFMRAVDRVSDVIQLAGGVSTWGDDTRIHVKHLTGKPDTVNVSEFYLTGLLRHNPLLSGGDIIFVPSIDLHRKYVVIEGNVGSQGIYQLRPSETLIALLNRLKALDRRSDIENVVLVRGNKKKVFNLLEAASGAYREVLQSGDRIIVPTNRDQVYVRGEVAKPGPYPYLANYTTKDYAGLAGIMESAKGLNSLMVIHAKTGKVDKGKDVVVRNGDIVVVPRRSRESFKDILSILTPIISIGLSAAALIQASK